MRSGPSRRTSRSCGPTRRQGRSLQPIRDVPAAAVASGKAGVWVLGVDGAVVRLDERSGRVVRRASITPGSVGSIAVGTERSLGHDPSRRKAVAHRRRARRVGRSDRARSRRQRPCGHAHGIWVANPIAGSLTHVDPETTQVVRTIDLAGIPRSIAIDGETVWVTVIADPVAAITSEVPGVATFAPNVCEPPLAGESGLADVLITLGPTAAGRRSCERNADGTARSQFVLRERGFRAGAYRVAYQSCDDSIASTGLYDEAKCASNARAYGENPDVLGVVGTFNSACAVFALPELNRAPNGPLAMVSPFNDFVGLTRQGPGVDPVSARGAVPDGRSQLRPRLPDGRPRGRGARSVRTRSWAIARLRARRRRSRLWSAPGHGVRDSRAARRTRRRGPESWDPRADEYAALAGRVAESGADAVYVGGLIDTNAGGVLRDLRRRLRPTMSTSSDRAASRLPRS